MRRPFLRMALGASFLLAAHGAGGAWAQEALRPYRAIIHVHTIFSSGELTPEQVAAKAKQSGLDIIVFTDHDFIRVGWGPPPLRHLIRRLEDRRSLATEGVYEYFNAVAAAQERHPEVLLIPGVETAPFHYLTGNPLKGNMIIHDWRRHQLLLGLGPRDVEGLPVLYNAFSLRYTSDLLPGTLFFLLPAAIGAGFLFLRGLHRWLGLALLVAGLLFGLNYHPFKSSPFDPYGGSQGVRPYQEVINYVAARGGLTLWAHQGALLEHQDVGSVVLRTPAHQHVLLGTVGYAAFDAIYEDNFTESLPGREWDRVLIQYARGQRLRPVWGYGGSDFHGESELGGRKRLTDLQNIVFMARRSEGEFLKALFLGRSYIVRGYGKDRLTLEGYRVEDTLTGRSASFGETLEVRGLPRVRFRVGTEDGSRRSVRAQVIRFGQVVETLRGETPLEVSYVDRSPGGEPTTYYRVDVQVSRSDHIATNPTFVRLVPARARAGGGP